MFEIIIGLTILGIMGMALYIFSSEEPFTYGEPEEYFYVLDDNGQELTLTKADYEERNNIDT